MSDMKKMMSGLVKCGEERQGIRYQEVQSSLAAPNGYAAWQLLEISAECQRNVDNAMCGLKGCDYNFAVAQLTVALDKAVVLRAEKERHTDPSSESAGLKR